MDINLFSMKELNDVFIKLTYPIEINGVKYEEGETIVNFDKISISVLEENKNIKTANGGFDNRSHIFWESTKDVGIIFSQGVFSKTQYSILTNSKILNYEKEKDLYFTLQEQLESDENGIVKLSKYPFRKLFLYEKETGAKVSYEIVDDQIKISLPFIDLIATYEYIYSNGASIAYIGQQLTNGFMSLEGKTRIKDENTGNVISGIIKIPRLKVLSGLSLKLGSEANPQVGVFQGVAVPIGTKGNNKAIEFYFLNEEIST